MSKEVKRSKSRVPGQGVATHFKGRMIVSTKLIKASGYPQVSTL